jgi:hypothetical protein
MDAGKLKTSKIRDAKNRVAKGFNVIGHEETVARLAGIA